MAGSPVEELISALDAGDLDRALRPLAADCSFLLVDGRSGSSREQLAQALGDFMAQIHRMEHRITAQWQLDGLWIAELEGDYELMDRSRQLRLPRAFILRGEQGAITDLRVYGAHERALYEHDHGPDGIRIGGRYMPPL